MNLLQTVRTVLWSFIGIRKRSEYEQDLAGRVNPFAVIAVAFVVVALFVVGLVLLVNWVVAK